jgi:hypothetical protein
MEEEVAARAPQRVVVDILQVTAAIVHNISILERYNNYYMMEL